MTKFLNKWMRVLHRWIAVPTLIIIPLAVISKFSGGTGGTCRCRWNSYSRS